MNDGGSLVPNVIAAELTRAAVAEMDRMVWEVLRDRRTWLERERDAIEAASLRSVVRRRTYVLRDMPRRLRNARAALAGSWDFDWGDE